MCHLFELQVNYIELCTIKYGETVWQRGEYFWGDKNHANVIEKTAPTKYHGNITFLEKSHVFHICKIFRNCLEETNIFQECDNPGQAEFSTVL